MNEPPIRLKKRLGGLDIIFGLNETTRRISAPTGNRTQVVKFPETRFSELLRPVIIPVSVHILEGRAFSFHCLVTVTQAI
jgi:hypothetical protein